MPSTPNHTEADIQWAIQTQRRGHAGRYVPDAHMRRATRIMADLVRAAYPEVTR